jgi:hypothetical protein
MHAYILRQTLDKLLDRKAVHDRPCRAHANVNAILPLVEGDVDIERVL